MANKFVAYFINEAEDKVVAVAAQGQGQALLTLMEALQQNQMPKASARCSRSRRKAHLLAAT